MMNEPPADQFWLARLQIINWGVFDGYHSVSFSAHGTLITGASGSGKSSLLDAISLGFLPHNRRNFNASGDSTAGAGAGRRSVDKYVRGAWGERRDGRTGSQIMYLRGEGPAWSAVATTYRSRGGRAVTGLVLKWFLGAATTEPSSRYCLAEGDQDIHDLCNRWIENDYDFKIFDNAGWSHTRTESKYLARLYSKIGIRTSEAAQQLLGKAKSLKSVGGLEQFIREYMLDEPESLTGVPNALKQIDPLVEARTLLDIAQRKRKILGNIESIQERYASESARLSVVDVIDTAMVHEHIDLLRLERAPAEIEKLDIEINDLGEQLDQLTAKGKVLTSERDRLVAQIANVNSSITPLKAQLEAAQKHHNEVAARRKLYDEQIFALEDLPPDNAEDFIAMRELFAQEATRIRQDIENGNQTYNDAAGHEAQARTAAEKAKTELQRVQVLRSAIPQAESDMREMIAHALGLPTERLRFVAELMDLKTDQQRWRPAVEKVLRSAGLRLLVPDEHHSAVLRFVNRTNMRGRIQLQHVKHGGPPRSPGTGTLASKLQVAHPGHESAAEALNVIATVGDYHCVDSPDEFAHHRRAVTDQGLRKDNDRLSVKDDRRQLRESEFIYVGDIESKIAALRVDLDEAEDEHRDAKKSVSELFEQRQKQQSLASKYQSVHDMFTRWSEIDSRSTEEQVTQLNQEYDALLADNPDIELLTSRAEKKERDIEKLLKTKGDIENRQYERDRRRTGLLELCERVPPGLVPDQARLMLSGYHAEIDAELDLLRPESYRAALLRVVKRERDALHESRNRSRNELSRIIDVFDSTFEDAIPNDGGDFDERVHDYVTVCRHIDERELPDANSRMRRLITEQAPDAILNLHRTAEQEARRITEQIARVNTGLGSVEYNRGTRLTLRATERQLTAVNELKNWVTAISHRIAAVSMGDEQAILDQYRDILTLRQRLDQSNPETRLWTRDALDVRNRFAFDCAEWDAQTGQLIRTHSNAGDNSGGEQEKLMGFCLAGALSYNLANPETDDPRPVFAQLMLDEAFSKSDPEFAQQTLSAFRKFGFQLVIVTVVQNTTTVEPFIDSVAMVSKTDATSPSARPVASVSVRSLAEFTAIRRHIAATAIREVPTK